MYRYKRYKHTSEILNNIFEDPKDYLIIHYSCESFHEDNTKSPRITAIAVQNYSRGQTHLFSIHKELEIGKDKLNIDQAEISMLEKYFKFVDQNKDKHWVHWNMRDSNYGFFALEHRYNILFNCEPIQISDDKKIDLSRLLKDRFTNNYIDHPRMSKLADLNGIKSLGFLKGGEEALAFSTQDFTKLSHSTAAKVDLFSEIISLTIENRLKTNSSTIKIYGKNAIGLFYAFKSKWYGELAICIVLLFLGAIIGEIVSNIFL